MSKVCDICGKRAYSDRCFKHKKRKALPKQSVKEQDYQAWKEEVARPEVIKRDGSACWCCGYEPRHGEKLDLDHIITKGSHPNLKRDIGNLRLLDRYCHHMKTIGKPCIH